MFGKARGHRFNDAELVRYFGYFGKEVANPGSSLTSPPESPGRFEDLADGLELRFFNLSDFLVGVFAVVLLEHGLVVEGVDLGHAPLHKQEYDIARLWREVPLDHAPGPGLIEQGAACERPESQRGTDEHFATCDS